MSYSSVIWITLARVDGFSNSTITLFKLLKVLLYVHVYEPEARQMTQISMF